MRDQNIICISWLPWDPLPLVMHHMMSRLSVDNKVLFVDPPGGLSTPLRFPREAPEVKRRVGRWIKGVRQENPNLWVYSPPPQLATFGHSDSLDRLNHRVTERAVGRLAAKLGFESPILWMYDPHAVVPRGQFGEKLVIYDSNDDVSAFAGTERKRQKSRAADEALAQAADVLFVTARELWRRKEGLNPNMHLAPSGIDFELFNRAAQPDCTIAPEVRDLPQPVIGYIGSADQVRIGWSYVRALAEAQPGGSIVFIGPNDPPRDMLDRPNVHFFGSRPQSELAEYIRAFAVGIIPFAGEWMKASQPTKTFEYMAAGKMTVATAIPELMEAPELAGVVKVAQDEAEFVRMVGEAVEEGQDPAQVERCVEGASNQTWDARVALTTSEIEAALKRKAEQARRPAVVGVG